MALVLAVSLSFIALLLYTLRAQAANDEARAFQSSLDLAKLTAAQVEQFLKESRQTLETLARRPILREAVPAKRDPILDVFSALHPEFATMLVVDRTGQAIHATTPTRGKRLPNVRKGWFEEMLKTDDFVVSRMRIGRLTGRRVVVLGYPLRDGQGRINGALAPSIDLVRFHLMLRNAQLVPGAVVSIIDGQGTVLARSRGAERWVGKDARGHEIADVALRQESGQLKARGLDNELRFYSFMPVRGTDWKVCGGIQVDEALAESRAATRSNFLLMSLGIGFATLLAALLAIRIERPIAALRQATRAAARGEMESGVPLEGPLEIADVAEEFNAMLNSRRQVEMALKQNQQRLQLILQGAHIGLWEWNLITNEVYLSPEWKSQIGYEDHEIENVLSEWENRVHPRDIEGAAERVRAYLADPWPNYSNEFRMRHKDGSWRWILAMASLQRDANGRAVRMIGAHVDVTERKQMEEALAASREQLRALATRLETSLEEERAGIARELHDELGQTLTAFKMDLAWFARRLPQSETDDGSDPLRAKIADMNALIDSAIHTTRRISSELRPTVLDDLGLEAAIEWLTQEFSRRTGIRCQVSTQDVPLDRPRATAAFRILQEALTNITRHAGASEVEVRLARSGYELLLAIADNGKGIAPELSVAPTSLGLLGMRERAERVGGSLSITSEANLGTKMVLRMPLDDLTF
jgi:two-component system sensor histidine kinase UhpB